MKKQILSMVLTLALCLSLLPTVSIPAAAVETETSAVKTVMLGTSGISGYDSTNGYDYIYYGKGNGGAIYWRVLDDQTNTGDSGLFLLSNALLADGIYFDNSENGSSAWQGSTAQAWCKDFAGIEGSSVTDAFTTDEFDAVLATTKSDEAFTSTERTPFSASENILNGDKVFFLSAEEAENVAYGFTDDNARKAYNSTPSMGTRNWWLRSPFSDVSAGVVHRDGYVATMNVSDDWGARPAFNLDTSKVLFTSAADGSAQKGFGAVEDYADNKWKVTLADGNNFSSGTSFIGTTALTLGYDVTELTITHAALSSLSGDYTNVTAMLTDDGNNILYYGSINETTSATSSTVTIPTGLAAGDYILSVYGEDWNEANYTNYATGTPYTIEITVHEHSWATDWSGDDTHHWHECQNSGCTVTENSGKDGYAAHSFTLETVKNEALKSAANCDDPATYYKSCECGKVSDSETDTFTSGSALGHDWGEWGSISNTQHQRTCRNENSHSETKNHAEGTARTCEAASICSDCGYVFAEALGHSWVTTWSKDNTHHWHECQNSGCPATENSRKDGYAAHSFTVETISDATLKSAANCDAPDTYYKSCECGTVSDSETDTFTSGSALGHSYGEWTKLDETQHSRTCSHDSRHVETDDHTETTAATCDAAAFCNVCNNSYGDTLGHSWATTWSKDDTHHWHECGNSGCPVTENSSKDGYAAHSFDDDSDADCNDNCGYTRTITPSHTHSLVYAYSDAEHWQECSDQNCPNSTESITNLAAHRFDYDCDTDCNDSCGYTRQTSHSPLAGWIEGENGHWHDCEFCGEDLDLAGHNYKTEWSYDADWHWHECAECGYSNDIAGHSYDSDTDTTCLCGYNTTKTAAVYVGGLGLAEGEYLSNSGASTTTAPANEGYAHYTNGVLTLKDYEYSGAGYTFTDAEDDEYTAAVYSENALTVELTGESTLAADGMGIYSLGDITFKGTGTLNINSDHDGVDSKSGDITVEDGTLNIVSADQKGIDGNYGGNVTIAGGEVNITAWNAQGIDVDDDGVFTMSGGTLNIAAGADGVDCEFGDLIITGGTLEITAGERGLETEGEGNIILSNMVIQTPIGGKVGTVAIDDATYATIVDASGIYATEVELTCKTTPTLTLTPSSTSLSGGGNLTLTVGGLPTGGSVTITCDNTTYNPTGSGTTWSVTLPNTTAAYVFTASFAGDDAHNSTTATCTVDVTYKGSDDTTGGGDGGYTPPDTPSTPVTPSTPPTESVTVPISGDEETIHVDASVTGDKAVIDVVDLSHLDTVIGDHVDTGTVTIDFSGLDSGKPITTVEIPSDVVKQIAEAVNDPGNDAESLEIILSDGTSIEFDAVSLSEKAAQADGLDITISIEHHEDAKLTNAQKNAVGDRPAFDISVTSGGKHISDMGGNITVHAPYELKAGEKARGIVVWYVDDHGNRECCETSYDPVKQRVNWQTDHLSLYMIDYDEVLAGNPFTDVSGDAYYFDAVMWALDKGITGGTSATTFSPYNPCTRAQMATFLWRAAGAPDPAGNTNPFADVSADAYYAKAVQWAVEQGITVGTSTTTFSPDADCTRAQMATFLWRNAGSPAPVGSTNPFADVSTDAYYTKAVQWAYEQEITGGTSATTFSPDAPCTRAQMITFLYRFFVKE